MLDSLPMFYFPCDCCFPPKEMVLHFLYIIYGQNFDCLLHRRKKNSKKMKGTSKVIMGATLVMAASLAIVLGLILVFLAELYCFLLLRRRQLKSSATTPTPTPTNTTTTPSSSSLCSVYAQGVLHAPTNFLFPHQQVLEIQAQEPNIISPHQIGILYPTSPPFTSFVTSPPCNASLGNNDVEDLVYISNPIYDNDAGTGMPETQFMG